MWGVSQQDLGAGPWVSGPQFKVGLDPVLITAALSAHSSLGRCLQVTTRAQQKPESDQLWLGFQGLTFLSPTSLPPADSTQRPPQALLPTHVAPLAFLLMPGQPYCRQCHPTVCFCGDPRQLLLHSQHLAYAYCWQCGVLAASPCQD